MITPTAIWNSNDDSFPNELHQDQNFPTATANNTMNPALRDWNHVAGTSKLILSINLFVFSNA